jgi:hypothetical protein
MPTPGYRSVTIHQKYYEDAQIIASQKGLSVSELFEWLLDEFSQPFVRAKMEQITANKDSNVPKFIAPFHAFVLDERKVKYYQSTSWVRTPEYAKRMHEPLLRELENRIYRDDEFNVDKLFIVSSESWKTKEVWEWINQWLAFASLRKKQLRIFVLRQKTAEEILRKLEKDDERRKRYFDMGIYRATQERQDQNDTVGFLEIETKSQPGSYTLFRALEDAEQIETAEKYFDALKRSAERIEDIESLPMLEKQSYD